MKPNLLATFRRSFRLWIAGLILVVTAGCLPAPGSRPPAAPSEDGRRIVRVFADRRDQAFHLRITGNRPLTYSAVRLRTPLRTVLYFPDTRMEETGPVRLPENRLVSAVRIEQMESLPPSVRVAIDLQADIPHRVSREKNTLCISFPDPAPKAPISRTRPDPAKPERAEPERTESHPEPPAAARRIRAIETAVFPDHDRLLVRADGPVRNFRIFTVSAPPKIVVDLYGLSGDADPGAHVSRTSGRIRSILRENLADRIRLVLETVPDLLDAYRATPVPDGLLLHLGPSSKTGEPSATPRSDAPETDTEAWVHRIRFDGDGSGRSRFDVETTRPVPYRIVPIDDRRFHLELDRCILSRYLLAARFESAGVRAIPLFRPTPEGITVIAFERAEPLAFHVEQSGAQIHLHFQAPLSKPGIPETGAGPWREIDAGAPAVSDSEIRRFLSDWKAAWERTAGEEGEMGPYMAFYSDRFFSRGLDRSAWEEDKRLKNRRRPWIEGELREIQIAGPTADQRLKVRFFLDYRSGNYRETIEKTMTLVREPAGWRIIGEKSRLRR